jgi:hypothetical protein
MPKISRLARVALGLGIGTSLSLVLMGLDGWFMSQGVLETHDLPELLTWVLPLPTLVTLVLALLARGRIAANGGALIGRGLVRGALWLTGINGVVLLGFALLLLSGTGESYRKRARKPSVFSRGMNGRSFRGWEDGLGQRASGVSRA